jgi:hypothetical protein
MAEAGRPDGFKVISLGYVAGPNMTTATLFNQSTVGYATMMTDISVTEEVVGMRHYLTAALVDVPNTFVMVHSNTSLPDHVAPVWSSTYNDNSWPPAPPTVIRVGIQQAVVSSTTISIYWDVAYDLNGVSYALYYSKTPFNFKNSLTSQGTRVVMTPTQPSNYLATATTYPYEYQLTGLSPSTTYYLVVRAFDNSPNSNEEANTVSIQVKTGVATSAPATPAPATPAPTTPAAPSSITLAAQSPVPTSAGPIWQKMQLSADTNNLYIFFSSYNTFNLDGSPTYGYPRINIFIDVDNNPSTGYVPTGNSGFGSELLLQGVSMYKQSSGTFDAGYIGTATVSKSVQITQCNMTVPIATLKSQYAALSVVRVIGLNDEISQWIPTAGSHLSIRVA